MANSCKNDKMDRNFNFDGDNYDNWINDDDFDEGGDNFNYDNDTGHDWKDDDLDMDWTAAEYDKAT